MKRREEKWEEEESGREGGGAKWAACQPNTEPFIDRCTLTYTLLQRLSSLFLSFHRSAILYLTLTLSMSHVSSSSRLYLSPSRFSFPLLSVVVFPFLSLFRSLSPRTFNSPCVDLLVLSFLPPFISPQLSAYPCAHVLSSSLYVFSNCVLRQQSRGRATCQHTLM